MGCTNSKLNDLPAVKLCRDRCSFLDEAIHQRYALAEAHIGYIHSLRGIGQSLTYFIPLEATNSSGEPTLNLPPVKKGDQVVKSGDHSRSNSGSHLHFRSDSDSDSDSLGSLHHSGHSSPLHLHGGGDHGDYMIGGLENLYPAPAGFAGTNIRLCVQSMIQATKSQLTTFQR